MQPLELKCPWFRGLRTSLVIGALALASASLNAAEKWRMQYFYDKEESSLTFTDIECPSAKRCVASGILVEGKRDKGVVATTSDGGANWQLEDVKDHPVSLFFLNESLGWMVTDRGIYQTEESGHGWKKIKDQKQLERVYFATEQHGWAVGAPKVFLETNDGGRKWTEVPEAKKPPTAEENTVYHWITFANPQKGMVIGSWTLPHSPEELPAWMAPERSRYRNPYPATTILLQTTDGGKTWTELSSRLEGLLSQFRYGNPDYGIGLFQFPSTSDKGSELIRMDFAPSKNTPIYHDVRRAVSDFVILPAGGAVAATIERPGKSNALPIPGKLKMMRSTDPNGWAEMDIDYRAVASRAYMAAPDANNLWVATDTGMILKLQ